jgi:LmbE family N-acetylglucosaminyl deacetylase
MKFNNKQAEVYIPDGAAETTALSRTTSLCIAAHQDDIEIMAFSPAVECYGISDRWFTGVVVTDGAGSPRSGIYAKYTDEEMKDIRILEQKTAATVGKYSVQFLLSYASREVKDAKNEALIDELASIIEKCAPTVVYTHNLADKHDTHVSVALRTIAAIRKLPVAKRPKKVYSLEVWRGLDWLCDEDKTVFDTAKHPNLAAALLGVYDSQIAGGKRYDLAAIGRRTANATFFASHDTDDVSSASYGLDITALVNDEKITPQDFIVKYIENFKTEIMERIGRFSK